MEAILVAVLRVAHFSFWFGNGLFCLNFRRSIKELLFHVFINRLQIKSTRQHLSRVERRTSHRISRSRLGLVHMQIVGLAEPKSFARLDHKAFVFVHRPDVISIMRHKLGREVARCVLLLVHRVKVNIREIFKSSVPWFVEVSHKLNFRGHPKPTPLFLLCSFVLKRSRCSPCHQLRWVLHYKSLAILVENLVGSS
jgi:hypothetical protein